MLEYRFEFESADIGDIRLMNRLVCRTLVILERMAHVGQIWLLSVRHAYVEQYLASGVVLD